MAKEKTYVAKIFQNGMSQAVRLPKALRVSSKEVYIKKARDGLSLVLVPKTISVKEFFDSPEKCTEDFLVERNQSAPQERKIF